ncbi:MAG: DUF6089 family protein, partial [Flavobacteriales bacterium]|nr:DUF6089 family protein [Flavobacteriales bacterium]
MLVKHFILFIFVFITIGNSYGGRDIKNYEFFITGGASYYTGELNYEGHFRKVSPSVGLGIRQNIDTRWSIRYNLLYLKAKGDDPIGRFGFPVNQAQSFVSNLYELSAVAEFNFFPFSTAEEKSYPATPFLFAGLGGFYHNPSGSTVGLDADGFSNMVMNLPFGFGFKFKASQRLIFTVETGLRKTYTDHIDAASTIYQSSTLQHGHSENKDWYSYT